MTTEVAVPPTLGGATAERMRADLERYRDLALQSGALFLAMKADPPKK